jgi:hypothetical protein
MSLLLSKLTDSNTKTNLHSLNYEWPREEDLKAFQDKIKEFSWQSFSSWSLGELRKKLNLPHYETAGVGVDFVLYTRHDEAAHIASMCRCINVRLQTQQEKWILLLKITTLKNEMKGNDTDPRRIGGYRKEIAELQEQVLESLKEEHERNNRFLPGPVGDLVIHHCFILELYEIGIALLDSFPRVPRFIDMPYVNDLEIWRKRQVESKEVGRVGRSEYSRTPSSREDGLYTGETILHIAIVKQDMQLVNDLLERGASLSSCAIGVFFQPKSVPWLEKPSKHWQDMFKDWVLSIDRNFAVVKVEFNPESRCYYGEFPLSFAASVGNVDICKILYACKKTRLKMMTTCTKAEWLPKKRIGKITQESFNRIEPPHDTHPVNPNDRMLSKALEAATPFHQTMVKPSLGALVHETRQAVEHGAHSLWAFVNACDAFGNTAMHMAVLHGRKTAKNSAQLAICQHKLVLDWLMSIDEGRCCLETCNLEGYTPFTLAARNGNVEMFDHILNNHMSSNVWRYGKVQMRKRDMRQLNTYEIRKGAIPYFTADDPKPCDKEFYKTNDCDNSSNETQSKPRSALEVIVIHEVEAFATHEVIRKLIYSKWHEFGLKMYFYHTLLPYTVLLVFFAVLVVLRSEEVQFAASDNVGSLNSSISGNSSTSSNVFPAGGSNCIRGALGWSWTGRISNAGQEDVGSSLSTGSAAEWRIATLALEAGVVCVGSPWLVVKGWRERHIKRRDLDMSEDGKLSSKEVVAFAYKNINFLQNSGIAFTLLIAGIFRLCCNDRLELTALAVASILLFSNILNILMPFKYIGVLVIIIFRMLVGDIFRFFVVYLATLAGFAFGMLLLTSLSKDLVDIYGSTFTSVFMHLFWAALGVDGLDDLTLLDSQQLAIALHVVWVVISSILMLNLLIAMMGRTFEKISEDAECAWIFPFARLVLRYEKLYWSHKGGSNWYFCSCIGRVVEMIFQRGVKCSGGRCVGGDDTLHFGFGATAAEVKVRHDEKLYYDFFLEDVEEEVEDVKTRRNKQSVSSGRDLQGTDTSMNPSPLQCCEGQVCYELFLDTDACLYIDKSNATLTLPASPSLYLSSQPFNPSMPEQIRPAILSVWSRLSPAPPFLSFYSFFPTPHFIHSSSLQLNILSCCVIPSLRISLRQEGKGMKRGRICEWIDACVRGVLSNCQVGRGSR